MTDILNVFKTGQTLTVNAAAKLSGKTINTARMGLIRRQAQGYLERIEGLPVTHRLTAKGEDFLMDRNLLEVG